MIREMPSALGARHTECPESIQWRPHGPRFRQLAGFHGAASFLLREGNHSLGEPLCRPFWFLSRHAPLRLYLPPFLDKEAELLSPERPTFIRLVSSTEAVFKSKRQLICSCPHLITAFPEYEGPSPLIPRPLWYSTNLLKPFV